MSSLPKEGEKKKKLCPKKTLFGSKSDENADSNAPDYYKININTHRLVSIKAE